jgi:predicted ATPase
MKFYIKAYNPQHGESYNGKYYYPHVILITDRWDDFSYETLFRAYLYVNENECTYLGKLKILNGYRCVTRDVLESEFEILSEDFCSLGQTIEYYRTLKHIREKGNEEIAEDILTSLNDIAYDKTKEKKFIRKFSSSGISTSLKRDSEAYHVYLFGHSIYFNTEDKNSNESDYLNFKFSYKIPGLNDVHTIDFDFSKKGELPNRINVIVGKNGTGKTKILSSLASYLSGYKKIDDSVEINNRPFFSRYIAISYSAFDNFNMFKETFCNRNNIANTLKAKISDAEKIFEDTIKYIECQKKNETLATWKEIIKDIYNTLQSNQYLYELIESPQDEILGNEDNDMTENRLFSYVYCGIKSKNKLINDNELLDNFTESYRYIKKKNRQEEWKKILSEIIEEKYIIEQISDLREDFSKDDLKKLFSKFSSGQKITIYIFTEVIENITPKSFLLIDEPEIHLHPNAISNFMRMINVILEKFDSYAVIATHSPLILQEIPSRSVRVFKRFNNTPFVDSLSHESFGENISIITNEIFNVREVESNYKTYLRILKENGMSYSEIVDLFDKKLSFNALTYLNSIYTFNEEENE